MTGINCKPVGGISNRLKFIISTIYKYKNINLLWDIPMTSGVGCDFNDIFKNKFVLPEAQGLISDCKFIDNEMNTHNSCDQSTINKEKQEGYIEIIESLKPVDIVSELIESELIKINGEFDTVSVRTFKSFPRENLRWGVHFKIDRLFKELDKTDLPFLLTCDDTNTVNLIKERYGNRVLNTNKRTKFGDFQSIMGMQDILVDLYVGGRANNIIGTAMSSYSEMQWWMGSCKSNFKQLNLHR
jgi:hypothetical protein